MIRTLTITYDKSNEDIPVMCVGESNLFSISIIKVFTGEKAEQLYKELTGQNVTTKVEEVVNEVSPVYTNVTDYWFDGHKEKESECKT